MAKSTHDDAWWKKHDDAWSAAWRSIKTSGMGGNGLFITETTDVERSKVKINHPAETELCMERNWTLHGKRNQGVPFSNGTSWRN